VRSYFNKHNGSLGTNGSLSFIFDRKGILTVPQGALDADEFEMEMIDTGAEDIQAEEGYFIITTAMEDFGTMMKKLESMKIEPESAQLQRIPKDTTKLSLEDAKKVMRLIDIFEEDDDIQAVYHNLEMTDELMESL
jgi:transcriptional/translational regulatory protein YebC/TACO1